jgi:hypothetical protein
MRNLITRKDVFYITRILKDFYCLINAFLDLNNYLQLVLSILANTQMLSTPFRNQIFLLKNTLILLSIQTNHDNHKATFLTGSTPQFMPMLRPYFPA